MELVKKLEEAINHHVKEEETEFFPLCEENIDLETLEEMDEEADKLSE